MALHIVSTLFIGTQSRVDCFSAYLRGCKECCHFRCRGVVGGCYSEAQGLIWLVWMDKRSARTHRAPHPTPLDIHLLGTYPWVPSPVGVVT